MNRLAISLNSHSGYRADRVRPRGPSGRCGQQDRNCLFPDTSRVQQRQLGSKIGGHFECQPASDELTLGKVDALKLRFSLRVKTRVIDGPVARLDFLVERPDVRSASGVNSKLYRHIDVPGSGPMKLSGSPGQISTPSTVTRCRPVHLSSLNDDNGAARGYRAGRPGGNPSRPSGTACDQVYVGLIPGHSGGHPSGPRQVPHAVHRSGRRARVCTGGRSLGSRRRLADGASRPARRGDVLAGEKFREADLCQRPTRLPLRLAH